jgi:vacuolar-type H+-ATPase subunit I/STV1
MAAILYLVVKYLAYSGWMFFGLQKLRNDPSPLLRSLLLGLLRLCLGFFFGVLIYLLSSGLMSLFGYGLGQNVIVYLLVYVPVRWIEWGIMSMFLISPDGAGFLVGESKPDRLWRLGGIVISCLADIPLIISLGGVIPTGRFLC